MQFFKLIISASLAVSFLVETGEAANKDQKKSVSASEISFLNHTPCDTEIDIKYFPQIGIRVFSQDEVMAVFCCPACGWSSDDE